MIWFLLTVLCIAFLVRGIINHGPPERMDPKPVPVSPLLRQGRYDTQPGDQWHLDPIPGCRRLACSGSAIQCCAHPRHVEAWSKIGHHLGCYECPGRVRYPEPPPDRFL